MYTHIHTHTTPSHIPFFFQTHTAEVPLGKTSNNSLVYLDRGQIYSLMKSVSMTHVSDGPSSNPGSTTL